MLHSSQSSECQCLQCFSDIWCHLYKSKCKLTGEVCDEMTKHSACMPTMSTAKNTDVTVRRGEPRMSSLRLYNVHTKTTQHNIRQMVSVSDTVPSDKLSVSSRYTYNEMHHRVFFRYVWYSISFASKLYLHLAHFWLLSSSAKADFL